VLRLVFISGFGSCLTGAEKNTVEDWDVVTYSTVKLFVFLESDERLKILKNYAGGKESP